MSIIGLGGIAGLIGLFLLKKKPKDQVSITWKTPLIEIPTPDNPLDIRRAIVANAYSIENTGVSIDGTRLVFEKLLGPPGPPSYKWDLDRPFRVWKDDSGKWHTEGVSTCGLVGEGIQRRVGSKRETLYQPYDFRGNKAAIARFIQCAIKWGAWNYGASGEKIPMPGDYVVIGEGIRTHALTLISWDKNDAISIDGGQTFGGLQAALRRKRPYSNGFLGDRKIYGFVDCAKAKYGSMMLVPKGWKGVMV